MARAISSQRPHGRPWPIHVMLLPAVPVLALWGGNGREVHSLLPAWIALWSVVGALGLAAIVTIVQRDIRRTGMIVSLTAFEFSFHGRVVPAEGWTGLLTAVLLIGSIATVTTRMPDRYVSALTHLMNAVAIALVLANVVVVLINRPTAGAAPLVTTLKASTPTDAPDVWYIAPDRYPDLGLLEEHGIDTAGFADALVDRGFTVLNDARANYPSTTTSLGSAWNAQFLDEADGKPSPGAAMEALRDPLIGRWFRDAGYAYHHLGTWFDATASSTSASSMHTLQLGAEFFRAYEENTILPTLRAVTGAGWFFVGNIRDRQVRHARHQLQTLRQLASAQPDGREFVLAHLTLPHRPYVFETDGRIRSRFTTKANAYEAQLQYLNDELLSIFDLLQARDEPPIILLLPDEGLYPEDLDDATSKEDYDLGRLTPVQTREKLSITAALFDSGTGSSNHPSGTTAVNVVRSVLNRALGADLEPLPDVSYTWSRSESGTNILVPTDH